MQYDQLEAGRNVAQLAQLCLSGVDIGDESVQKAVAVRGTAPQGTVVFGLAGNAADTFVFRGRAVEPDTLAFHRSEAELDVRFSRRLISFVVDPALLERRLGEAELGRALEMDRVALPTAQAEAIRCLAREILQEFQARPELLDSPTACRAGGDQLVDRLVTALRDVALRRERRRRSPGPAPRRAAAAKKAEAFILDHLDAPLTTQDLLDVTSVRERTLRAGFVERFGHGPKAHATLLRLNAVRRGLRTARPGETVTELATGHGFWHLGRFSRAYRRVFGELPSQTLRRSGAGSTMRE